MSPIWTRSASQRQKNGGSVDLNGNGGPPPVAGPSRRGGEGESDKKVEEAPQEPTPAEVHLNLIAGEAEEQREEKKIALRSRLRQLRAQIREGKRQQRRGRDAVAYLPEEVWAIIFEYLNGDVQDLYSCYKTCALFQKILGKFKKEWMFRIVFPVICADLEKPEVLLCRAVCTQWTLACDKFLEHCLTTGEMVRPLEQPFTGVVSSGKLFNFCYTFGLPLNPTSKSGHDRIRSDVKLHKRNPFVGRSLAFEFDPPNQDYSQSPYKSVMKPVLYQCLKDFGPHIYHLKLLGRHIYVCISTKDYFNLIIHLLKHCPELESLCLQFFHVHDTVIARTPFPNHRFLETLHVHDHNADFLPILDALLKKYSKQLRCLETCLWNPQLYHQLPWDNLQRLVVDSHECSDWLDSVGQVTAPDLKQLGLRLDAEGRSIPRFRQVLKAVHNFAKVERLELEMPNDFYGFRGEEIFKKGEGDEGEYSSVASVTGLILTIGSNEHFESFDFLTYFPHVKRLSILFEHNHQQQQDPEEDRREPEEMEVEGEEENEEESHSEASGGEEEVEEEEEETGGEGILNFKESFWRKPEDSLKALYKSGVWEVMPRLEYLKVVRENSRDGRSTNTLIYSRQAYEARKKEALEECVSVISKKMEGSIQKIRFVEAVRDYANEAPNM